MKYLVFFLLGNSAWATTVEIVIAGLRSDKGSVAASLFAEEFQKDFPRKGEKATATKYRKVESKDSTRLIFENVPDGTYALALMHDENGDGKMNMALGIPREGFGFSNNPTIYFGPPSFQKASFKVEGEATKVEVKLKYML